MIFLGTPFAGSKIALWAESGLRFISLFSETNKMKLKDLQEGSKILADINHEFARYIKSRDRDPPSVEIACYYEEYPTKGTFVVDKSSAILSGVDPLSIEEEHSHMGKFQDEHRSGFISITNKLNSWINALDLNLDASPDTSPDASPDADAGTGTDVDTLEKV